MREKGEFKLEKWEEEQMVERFLDHCKNFDFYSERNVNHWKLGDLDCIN